ncbi:hypothetical protein A9Q84_03410 [Halobacteriovorax marinus]|uniref:Bacterial surface antigen (D15) domain-containing protein n=1 Tax=Halobacteriovorax marinus TaxID=97084 RepID=A0A1Y5FA35_9BACT|nr:hypothetical protein A9Q84_03410 [Halobacteriovorax marinus]
MKISFSRLFCSVILFISLAQNSMARMDASVETTSFKVSTQYGDYNFELHLPVNDENFTKRVVKILQEDTAKLAEYFQYAPREVVHFVLKEKAFEANGSATVFPRDLIVLRKFPPLGSEHLTTGDDYLQGLVLHELIHIIHMDQTEGVLEVIRTIFGAIGKLGGVTPRWFTEGVATWGESEFTDGGRLRNNLMRSQWEQVLITEGFCDSIDCLDNPGMYPYRQFPYWGGSFFMEYLEGRHKGSVRCLVKANNNNVPFFLNSAFRECFGISATDMYQKYRTSVVKKISERNEETSSELTKLANAIGAKDFQSGLVVIGNKVISTESDNRVKKVIIQDLVTGTFETLKTSGRITGIEKLSSTEISLKSFSDLRATTERSTEVYNFKTVEKIETKADYSFKYGDEIIGFKFLTDRWVIGDRDYIFPKEVTIGSLKGTPKGVYFKYFDIRDRFKQLAFYSFKENKVFTVLSHKSPFEILDTCEESVLIKKENSLYLVNSKQSAIIKSPIANRVIFGAFGAEKSVVLLDSAKSSSYVWNKGCHQLKVMRSAFKKVSPKVLKPNTEEINNQEVSKKSFPSFNHFLPKYWFFEYFTATDELSAWGVNTSINDPDSRHTLDLGMLYYPEISEVVPDVTYIYELPYYQYLSYGHSKTYSQSTFRKASDSAEVDILSYTKRLEFKSFNFTPSLYASLLKVDDFLSTRDEKEYGMLLKFKKPRTQFNDFFQELELKGRFFKKVVDGQKSFNGMQSLLSTEVNPFRRFYLQAFGTYGSLDKRTFSNGVLYGGGAYTEFHQFYGIPYSDIYGNEIKSGRVGLRWDAIDLYKGFGLVPFYFEKIHFLAGTDYIAADRILIGSQILRNKSLQSYWTGVRLDMTWFYSLPISIEMIKSFVQNKYGENVDTTNFLFKGGFSF